MPEPPTAIRDQRREEIMMLQRSRRRKRRKRRRGRSGREREGETEATVRQPQQQPLPLFAHIRRRARRRTCSAATAPALVEPFQRRDSGKMLSWGCLLALSLAALTGKKREKSFPSFSLKPACQSHHVLSSKAPSERQRRSGIRS